MHHKKPVMFQDRTDLFRATIKTDPGYVMNLYSINQSTIDRWLIAIPAYRDKHGVWPSKEYVIRCL